MTRHWTLDAALLLALVAVTVAAPVQARDQPRPDLTVADFEGSSYRPWVAEGNAFGDSPAPGTLPGQMAVEGFEGRGLASSFRGGDDATGTLTSPPFRVERPFLNFLIGGGKYPGETCLELLVDGTVARAATGPNDRPGGSERLNRASWEVAELAGRMAVLRLVDARKGGWGHISVDQIVQSDRPWGLVPTARVIAADAPFLRLPVEEKATSRRVQVSVDGRVARDFDIKIAEGAPDFATFLDLAPFRGKTLRVEADLPAGSKALEGIATADSPVDPAGLYREPGRPQFHFTSRRGWLNDPNGLVFFGGEYHLFYQHNPYGWAWGNMHWGHAVSRDLVHWAELPIAVYPHAYGDMAFSGSAVVDRGNTSGFGVGNEPPLVAAYTSTGRGECIIYSLDRGRTWTEYDGNPVVRHVGRDPRLLWHAASGRWAMAVYDEQGGARDVAFYSSSDLKHWQFESKIGGFYECPDLYELPVERALAGTSRWVLSAADGEMLLGRFDGRVFTPDPGGKLRTWHGDFYAAQTFSDEPKGRRVQVGWARGIDMPGRPFNQQMTVPCELSLRRTDEGIRPFARPVAELESLRSGKVSLSGSSPGVASWSTEDAPELLDLGLEVEAGGSGSFELQVPGATITYDAGRELLACNGVSAPLAPVGGSIRLRILVDRASVEVFGNDGRVAISRSLIGRAAPGRLTFKATGEGVRLRSIEVAGLASSWRD